MPRREYDFWVYILASRSHQLYVGMTNSLERRMDEHRAAAPGGHTARYNINRLVYFEHTQYVLNAIAREKELKEFSHAEKVALIELVNPTWIDLSEDWGHSLRAFWRKVEAGGGRQPQIPSGDDKQRGKDTNENKQPQIPCGDDKQRNKG